MAGWIILWSYVGRICFLAFSNLSRHSPFLYYGLFSYFKLQSIRLPSLIIIPLLLLTLKAVSNPLLLKIKNIWIIQDDYSIPRSYVQNLFEYTRSCIHRLSESVWRHFWANSLPSSSSFYTVNLTVMIMNAYISA